MKLVFLDHPSDSRRGISTENKNRNTINTCMKTITVVYYTTFAAMIDSFMSN